MPQYRVGWLLPISQPPIHDAWLRTDGGRIVAFGHTRPGDFTAPDEMDLGRVAVLPGLVNAHTHLELSWLRGRIPETDDFLLWLRSVIELSRTAEQQGEAVPTAVAAAVDEARRFGTALVGDVSNTLASTAALIEKEMPAVVFHELVGFPAGKAASVAARGEALVEKAAGAEHLTHTLSAHAPYSVSPALFGAIRNALQRAPFARSSVHLGESSAELEFLRDGTGPFRELLDDLGVWDPSWVAPGCGPVQYVDQMGFLDERLLVVHGVHFGAADLERLVAKGATLVTCPRGNIRTGAGTPPIAEFFESGARIAVGTDSLASVPDLSVFAELAEMRRLAPDIPARLLLETATVNGACALGFGSDFGVIDAGKRDRLIAVEAEGEIPNIEEYLVSGIHSSQIRWLS